MPYNQNPSAMTPYELEQLANHIYDQIQADIDTGTNLSFGDVLQDAIDNGDISGDPLTSSSLDVDAAVAKLQEEATLDAAGQIVENPTQPGKVNRVTCCQVTVDFPPSPQIQLAMQAIKDKLCQVCPGDPVNEALEVLNRQYPDGVAYPEYGGITDKLAVANNDITALETFLTEVIACYDEQTQVALEPIIAAFGRVKGVAMDTVTTSQQPAH